MEAYNKGIEQGADYTEIDLQMTSDGHLICMHDSTVDRTTNGSGSVSNMTLAQIKQLDAGEGEQVPTLDEVITTLGYTTNYYIETKRPFNPDMDAELLRVLENHNLIGEGSREGKVIIQSFSSESLQNIHSQQPSIRLVQLMGDINTSELNLISQYAYGIGPNKSNVNSTKVEAAHAVGLKVHPYTVNSVSDMQTMISYGVDGYFTNYPDVGINEAKKR